MLRESRGRFLDGLSWLRVGKPQQLDRGVSEPRAREAARLVGRIWISVTPPCGVRGLQELGVVANHQSVSTMRFLNKKGLGAESDR